MNRRRGLSDEDQALWSGFARSITPLRAMREPNQSVPPGNKPAPRPVKASTARLDGPPPKKPPPLAPLDRRVKQRVARGRDPIDARIDLHGMTQSEAHRSLLGFLRRAQADGARIVLVVTGKGESQERRERASERGVLKRQVPNWLSLPEFRSFVLGFDDAHVGHGGQGALYVRLRRPR
jgi:DNA-nicking Smr family endonuclease